MSRTEVQEHWNIPVQFLEIAAGKGNGPPFVKVGRRVHYRVADVEQWIAQNRYENTSQFNAKDGGEK